MVSIAFNLLIVFHLRQNLDLSDFDAYSYQEKMRIRSNSIVQMKRIGLVETLFNVLSTKEREEIAQWS